jgi:hypothetical protein
VRGEIESRLKRRLGEGVLEVEGAGAEAGEGREMGAGAERFADVVGETPYIGPFGTVDPDLKVGEFVADKFDLNGDRNGLSFDCNSLACKLIKLFTFDFFGGKHGGDLEEIALEGLEDFFDLGEGGDEGRFFDNGAVDIVAIGADPEVEGSLVFFIAGEELVGSTGILAADEHDHKAGRKRVEGARMTDLLDAGQVSKDRDETKGVCSLRFIDKQNAIICRH